MRDSLRSPGRTRGAGLTLALFVAACGSTTIEDESQTVASLIRHGKYHDALERAHAEAEKRPGDPDVQALYRDAQVAYFLDRGRQAVFAGEPDDGLADFYLALNIDSENPVVWAWILKTRAELAQIWLDRAHELTALDDLAGAGAAYEEVLKHAPDKSEARRGLARVLLLQNYRDGQSRSYFNEGLRNFRDLFPNPARREFGLSKDYDEENERAGVLKVEVERYLVEDRLARAREFEESELFFAARNEYRLALLLDDENEEAAAGLDRMDREARASQELAEAEMEIRKGDFEAAEDLLLSSDRLTVAQADHVTRLDAQIEDARLQSLYEDARSLERDYRYAESVAAYDRLLEEAEFYEDAIARRETLQEFMQRAEEFYSKALSAESDEETARYLRQILIIWPEYRDVPKRLAEVEERLSTPPQDTEGDR